MLRGFQILHLFLIYVVFMRFDIVLGILLWENLYVFLNICVFCARIHNNYSGSFGLKTVRHLFKIK